jgi:TetR/AcrR family transcriptional regulator, lmrAB and yxaGH operons repressor
VARLVAEKHDVVPKIAEVFREHGYHGASLSLITSGTGLGKGSLYHFFPGGKPEMAHVILESIEAWFEDNIFKPLSEEANSGEAIDDMFSRVVDYFRSGQRVCLVGAMALDSSREAFTDEISSYFRRWIAALSGALRRRGFTDQEAARLAREVVGGIQGAIVLARAINDNAVFMETIALLKSRCLRS